MSEYRNDRFSRKPFPKKGGFGGPKQMYKANCAKCNDICEVPFRPNGKKPVYCSNCFVKDEGSAPRPSYGKREFSPRPSFSRPEQAPRDDRAMQDMKRELQGVNDKLERLIRLMETSAAPAAAAKPAKAAVAAPAKKKPATKKAGAKKK